MQVVFNHPLMVVIDYPAEDAVEMLDKRAGRVGLMRGAMAQRFRHDFGIFLSAERNEDQVEDFIDAYSGVMDQPVSRH
ncbi:MAG: DUF3567 family protein [Rhodocyclaceae bacterium]|nr:DUF3567 family protein [Rhodocyclaceae bacterium]